MKIFVQNNRKLGETFRLFLKILIVTSYISKTTNDILKYLKCDHTNTIFQVGLADNFRI